MQGKFLKILFSFCIGVSGLSSISNLSNSSVNSNVPHADGYWTDGYWDDATQTWHDGYWTETSPTYTYYEPQETDTCGWVEDWSNPDGGYCSKYITQYQESYNVQPVQTVSYNDNMVKIGNYSANIVYGIDQWIVDMPGTAAMFDWNGKTVIADHAYQGFKVIRNANTAIVNGRQYTLASRYYGNWYDDTIILTDGREFSQCNDGTLVMYTCTGSGATVTYWN